jgi:hypothetical protein
MELMLIKYDRIYKKILAILISSNKSIVKKIVIKIYSTFYLMIQIYQSQRMLPIRES